MTSPDHREPDVRLSRSQMMSASKAGTVFEMPRLQVIATSSSLEFQSVESGEHAIGPKAMEA